MGVMMKGDKDILTLQVKGDGLLQGITVTADSKGRVKGYVVEPDVIIPANAKGKLDVGGAVGQNIAGAMNNMMGGINQQTMPGAVPSPIPTATYHVAVNGQATGPFDISVLAQMATARQLTVDSLVWKNGMEQWAKAGTVDELKSLFTNVMPPIPTIND